MEVIDADGHIVEKETDIRAYLPEPHCKRSGSLLPSDGQDSLMGGRLGGLEDNDLPTRLRDMDIEGISTSVLFPTTSLPVRGLSLVLLDSANLVKSTLLTISPLENTSHKLRRWRHCGDIVTGLELLT
jgi:hypothetical protein